MKGVDQKRSTNCPAFEPVRFAHQIACHGLEVLQMTRATEILLAQATTATSGFG
jgi:hypothetical protein